MDVSSLLNRSDGVGGEGDPMEMKLSGHVVESVKYLVEEL